MKRDQFLKLLSEIEYQNSLYLERKKKLNPKRFKEMVKAKIAKLWKKIWREILNKFGSDTAWRLPPMKEEVYYLKT